MSRRLVQVLGLGAAGGVGYYFYKAGGDPNAAQKRMEHDAKQLSAKLKGDEKDVSRQAELSGKELGAKVDEQMARAKSEGKELQGQLKGYASDAEKRLEQGRKEAGSTLSSAVDSFDKNVQKGAGKVSDKVSEGADKAQSGIGGWFGGGKK